MTSPIEVTRYEDGKIAVLALNRPSKLNAMSLELMDALYEKLSEIHSDTSCRVVILKGNGRGFCAGADLLANREGIGGQKWDSRLLASQQRFSRCILKMADIRQPIIAAVHGACVGGGMSIALAADMRIAGKSLKMSAAFLTLGLSGCELGISYYLPRLVGLSHATELLMTGEMVTAEKAERLNLVNYVVNDDELEAKALELARKLLKASPLGLMQTKRQLRNAIEGGSLQQVVHSEDIGQLLCLNDRETAKFIEEKGAPFAKKNKEKGPSKL